MPAITSSITSPSTDVPSLCGWTCTAVVRVSRCTVAGADPDRAGVATPCKSPRESRPTPPIKSTTTRTRPDPLGGRGDVGVATISMSLPSLSSERQVLVEPYADHMVVPGRHRDAEEQHHQARGKPDRWPQSLQPLCDRHHPRETER